MHGNKRHCQKIASYGYFVVFVLAYLFSILPQFLSRKALESQLFARHDDHDNKDVDDETLLKFEPLEKQDEDFVTNVEASSHQSSIHNNNI